MTLFFVVSFSLATLALAFVASIASHRALTAQIDVQIASDSAQLVAVATRGGDRALKNALLRRDDRGVNNLGYLLFDADGRRTGGELATGPLALGWHDIVFTDPDRASHPARALTVLLPDRSRLTVAAETAPARALLNTMILLFGGGLALFLLIGIAGSLLFSRVIRRRLAAMNDTARAIIRGDLAQRIPVRPAPDEFDLLAATLNEMLDRTETLVANLRQVSSDLAHDLRTPIVHLQQRLEKAQRADLDDRARTAAIDQALIGTGAILSLFAAILRIAEVESGALRQYFARCDLSTTTAMIADSYRAVADDCGRSLACDIAPAILVEGDAELLSQALVNLIENALRHTPVGAHINVSLRGDAPGWALLAVEDDGPGIAAADRPRLLRRFTRLERSRTTQGHGLGLSLANAVATAHGGTLSLDDSRPGAGPGAGLAVRLRLPTVPHHG